MHLTDGNVSHLEEILMLTPGSPATEANSEDQAHLNSTHTEHEIFEKIEETAGVL